MGVKPLQVDGTVDIETEDWDKFVVGECYHANGETFVSRDPIEFFKYLASCEGEFWAHNSGRFDGLWFLDTALAFSHRVEVATSGSRATCIKLGKFALRDSFALVPLRLAEFAEMGGVAKSETGLPCVCGAECGGYCSIRRDMPLPLYKRLLEYLHIDCKSLYLALRALFSFAAEHGFILRGTLGASAWESARAIANLPPANWNPREYYTARKGYYGGRCQVFRTIADAGHRYDINSAYPYALTQPVPVGNPIITVDRKAGAAWERGLDGVYQATVKVPSNEWIPPLPYRLDTGRVAYPTGIMSGYWTGIELANAVDHGVKVLKWGLGVVWPTSEPIVKPFIDRVWPLRFAVGKNTPMGKWLKLFANSFSGKCAQDPKGERVVINPKRKEIKYCNGKIPCSKDHCTGQCGKWTSIDIEGRVWVAPRWNIAKCAHIHWAAQLTARCRIQLHNQLLSGHADAIYCDTDSCYSISERKSNIGQELGQWGYDGPLRNWYAIGPKAYRYNDETEATRVRCKGLGISNPHGDSRRASVENFERYQRGEQVGRAGVMGLKTAARSDEGRLFQKHTLARASHANKEWAGDRRIGAGGITYPVTLEALEGRD